MYCEMSDSYKFSNYIYIQNGIVFRLYIFIHLIPVFIIHILYDILIEYTTKTAICWIAYQNLDIIELIVNTFFLNRLNTTLLTFASWCGICFYPNIPFMYVAICYFSLLLHLAQTKQANLKGNVNWFVFGSRCFVFTGIENGVYLYSVVT